MSRADNNRRWNARQRERGYMRGPQITAEAHERLRELAHQHRMSMGEVMTHLLLNIPLPTTGNPFGLSPDELLHARLQGYAS